MKKGIVIIAISILLASLFLPGGYGYWSDVLTIEGYITVVPAPIPTPIPIPIPDITSLVQAINAGDTTAVTDNPNEVEGGLPTDQGSAGSGSSGAEGQGGSAPEAIRQEDSSLLEDGNGNGLKEQPQTDANGEAASDAIPGDMQEGSELTDSDVDGSTQIDGEEIDTLQGGTSENKETTISDDAEQSLKGGSVQQGSEEGNTGDQVQSNISDIQDDSGSMISGTGEELQEEENIELDNVKSQEEVNEEPADEVYSEERRQSDSEAGEAEKDAAEYNTNEL